MHNLIELKKKKESHSIIPINLLFNSSLHEDLIVYF